MRANLARRGWAGCGLGMDEDPDDIPDLTEDFEALGQSRVACVEHEARPSAYVLVPTEYLLVLEPRSDDSSEYDAMRQHILQTLAIYF